MAILLDKSEPQNEPSDGDELNQAINTAKGKAVEALLNYALRRCRLSDQANKSHVEAWRELQPLFDAELAECRNGNFEFSALAGAYIGNLHYMSADWVHANFKKIFPLHIGGQNRILDRRRRARDANASRRILAIARLAGA